MISLTGLGIIGLRCTEGSTTEPLPPIHNLNNQMQMQMMFSMFRPRKRYFGADANKKNILNLSLTHIELKYLLAAFLNPSSYLPHE